MSDIKMRAAVECNSEAAMTVQYLEEFSGPHERIEEIIRSRLVEFAAELQEIKNLREVSDR